MKLFTNTPEAQLLPFCPGQVNSPRAEARSKSEGGVRSKPKGRRSPN